MERVMQVIRHDIHVDVMIPLLETIQERFFSEEERKKKYFYDYGRTLYEEPYEDRYRPWTSHQIEEMKRTHQKIDPRGQFIIRYYITDEHGKQIRIRVYPDGEPLDTFVKEQMELWKKQQHSRRSLFGDILKKRTL